ncbi:MAG TPA: serine/threonine protein kinase [Deltaproteobacteria bacterium]|nr:serine/threonine protein kinase [Deltaproteobacteria bacterium]
MALEIVQILASGTFGHVAVVRDSSSGRLLAAKVLRDAYIANSRVIRRMRDEATLLARLSHPNIVLLESTREVEGRPLLLLEWIRGAPLNAVLARSPGGLPAPEAAEVIRLVAGALHAAWSTIDPISRQQMRVIHRDIKPSNLLLSADGVLKIVDFGIAKGDFEGRESETISVVLGAEGYVAPERLDGAPDSPAGDIYALGCVFFELLTSRRLALSLQRRRHEDQLQRGLMLVRPPDAAPKIVRSLVYLLSAMAAYEPRDRPTHAQVIRYLDRLMAEAAWQPRLDQLAHRHVLPHLADLALTRPEQHPAWAELQFLQLPTGETPTVAPPRRIDEHLRRLLAEEGWHHRPEALRHTLAIDPSWTPAPFIEALDRLLETRPWWRRRDWEHDPRIRDPIVVILEFLQTRPNDEVRRHVRRLLRHGDPEVSAMAQLVFTAP